MTEEWKITDSDKELTSDELIQLNINSINKNINTCTEDERNLYTLYINLLNNYQKCEKLKKARKTNTAEYLEAEYKLITSELDFEFAYGDMYPNEIVHDRIENVRDLLEAKRERDLSLKFYKHKTSESFVDYEAEAARYIKKAKDDIKRYIKVCREFQWESIKNVGSRSLARGLLALNSAFFIIGLTRGNLGQVAFGSLGTVLGGFALMWVKANSDETIVESIESIVDDEKDIKRIKKKLKALKQEEKTLNV